MILIDTGPLFALFNLHDPDHEACKAILKTFKTPLYTTVSVVTEVCYLLRASRLPISAFAEFIKKGAVRVWLMEQEAVEKALELMEQTRKPLDFADASLMQAAQALKITRLFTLDERDFTKLQIQKGHKYQAVEIIVPR